MGIKSVQFEDVRFYFLEFLLYTDPHREALICVPVYVSLSLLPSSYSDNSEGSISQLWRLGSMAVLLVSGRPRLSREVKK